MIVFVSMVKNARIVKRVKTKCQNYHTLLKIVRNCQNQNKDPIFLKIVEIIKIVEIVKIVQKMSNFSSIVKIVNPDEYFQDF